MRTTITMTAINLLRRLFERHWIFLAIIGVLLACFPVLMCAAVTTINVEGIFNEFRRSLPPMVQEIFGAEMALTMTSRGLLAFAWNHPFVHAMFIAVMILLASRAIATEIESGTMELLLSQPISRPAYLATQMGFALMVLLVLIGMMLLGVYAGLSMFDLQRMLSGHAFLPVAGNLLSLQIAIYGVTLFLSSMAREGGRVVTIALMFVSISYLLQAVARLWPTIKFLLTYTIFEYYSPQRIILNNLPPWNNILILLGVGIIAGAAAWLRFMRRDIP
ncbi:MAG: ABC transporter permease subunit [candidate division KSB1 bacterium]|nr:ABC transporter permease subunit [candidate division KSB1 bacterium]MDZ7303396.1 ABC transporter permease subunit [candidate division KSB1 bacterium]MDZ7312286.1 ABC transporter permease subunit [candidate division KSB1 bacterium]